MAGIVDLLNLDTRVESLELSCRPDPWRWKSAMNVLDKIFWKRFADEYKLNPGNPGPACVAGMLQVSPILFMSFIALFRLAGRLFTLTLAAVGAETVAQIWNPMEFRAALLLAAVATLYVVRRRYWACRLQPERYSRFGEELNRGAITLLVAGLMSASGGLMFITFWVTKKYMAA